ncbi:hypothetical protein [Kitasatospora fiedleri]|uniref:hypothetical protein n=1 Tax=Kitasatospora fiedleri TaxID=2991545 RepID=UPI00249B9BFC|nr:hypothetical protein [Kitasatospora fiedleri]
MYASLLAAEQPAAQVRLIVVIAVTVAVIHFAVPLLVARPRRRPSVGDVLWSLLLGALAGPTFWVMTLPAVMVWTALALPVFFVVAVVAGYRLLRR